jgi:hypothetical protein
MDVYAQIAVKIIEQQQNIIGPVAIEQAKAVSGLKVDWDKREVVVSGNEQSVIDKLVAQYRELFGKISVEVCKEAASKLISQLPVDQQPSSLK